VVAYCPATVSEDLFIYNASALEHAAQQRNYRFDFMVFGQGVPSAQGGKHPTAIFDDYFLVG